jgi:hypothetical protein
VQYSISSRGQPIGTTDLGFIRFDASIRSGWFHPSSLGERAVRDVAMVLPAMQAFLCRDARDADGQSIVLPSFRQSSLFADLAEAFHRVSALELTLHHADGRLIPTALIGIQDTEQLLELSRWKDLYDPDRSAEAEEGEEDDDLAHLFVDDPKEFELPHGGWGDSDDDELDGLVEYAWVPDKEPASLPRYQVHVQLARANDIA